MAAVNYALYVPMQAKPGKEEEVAQFLRDGLALVNQEPGTIAWFGVRLSHSMFAIFDAFADEAGRNAHLAGKVADALKAKAPDLFASETTIEKAEVLAAKLP